MTDREFRLRARIDQLTDERDRLRDRVAALEKKRKRIYELRCSRDLWRHRATRDLRRKQGQPPTPVLVAATGPNQTGG